MAAMAAPPVSVLGQMMMERADRSFSFDPMIPVVNRILTSSDFIGTLKTAVDCLDSAALTNVSLVSLKSAPHVFFGDSQLVREFDNAVSCRLRYFEAAWMSVASLTYNVFFGVVMSIASAVTLGQAKPVLEQMRKHWVHAAFAAAALGISLTGTVSPELGIKVNVAGMAAIGLAILQWMQGDAVRKVCNAYQRFSQELKNAVQQGIRSPDLNYQRDFAPVFAHLDANLNDRVTDLRGLVQVMQDAMRLLPRVMPTVSPELVFNTFRQSFADWRDERPNQGGGAVGPEPEVVAN